MPLEKPRYSLIADHLTREIQDGRHPVGQLLPTEAELMRAFGVGRHTIRTAIQELKQRGLIESRQGQGSTVVTTTQATAYVETIQSIDQLITFGQETRRELISRSVVAADQDLAAMFGCGVGRRLAEVRMLRKTIDANGRTIALVTLWLDVILEPAVDAFSTISKSAAEIIHEQFGIETKVVRQVVRAEALKAADAAALGVEVGAPTLVIERRYHTSQTSEPFLIARSLCRADAIALASNFTQSGPGLPARRGDGTD